MIITKIIEVAKKTFAWGKEVATGTDGLGSASRVVVLLVASVGSGCLIAHVAMNHGLPSAEQLYGLSAFTASGAGAYVANRIGNGQPNTVNTTVVTTAPGGTNAGS